MNAVRPDAVSVQVSNTLDWKRLSIQLHLITLHHLLNGLANVTKTHVNSSRLDTSLSRLLHSFQQWIVSRIERNSKCTVNDSTVNLRTKVNLHHIIILQFSIIARIGSVMGSDVIDAATGGKANAATKPFFHHQLTILALQHLAHIRQFNARFDETLCIAAYLTMDFACMANLLVDVILHAIMSAFLSTCFAEGIALEGVCLNFTYWVSFVLK
mmetsp:Transcript_16271/g.23969  ORF Transcript_16271/g.23969 Transcript_16271/m.23969 type:complete len:213 (+) Transcript_16271:562-1200(+)